MRPTGDATAHTELRARRHAAPLDLGGPHHSLQRGRGSTRLDVSGPVLRTGVSRIDVSHPLRPQPPRTPRRERPPASDPPHATSTRRRATRAPPHTRGHEADAPCPRPAGKPMV